MSGVLTFRDTGKLEEADEIDTDPRLSTLAQFYDIWGVGDVTAREFYNKGSDYSPALPFQCTTILTNISLQGWRDLDDIVEYGWDTLTRVQQIGVKFYDDLRLKIPRAEVESIANTILNHAQDVDSGFRMVIVGGYRRGQSTCGDVDVVLSHPDETCTQYFIGRLVLLLEKSGFVSHTLSLTTRNSDRGQEPLQWKGGMTRASVGFDTLDKAMLVWRTPESEDMDRHGAHGLGGNPHRRVDIIVSPWKTVGCAVLGWTGGTTFERDLRRYCKLEKSVKFDSSGIRSRIDGSWIDIEGQELGKAPDMETAEKRVFEGLGLKWIRPEERCTR
ncbi:hypothetical protein jhhlp_001778 [Lomentospora prolificans]|uniref:DNA polymerase n=1 Tax=Lomentospora prolificans TaxID=41688 RepID=A0A2N3NGU5_9PEZI|nr:hypothetical protein jhhlp_001778 [Lomentospora prolificans]